MNDLTTWMQANWYALGTLLGQFAFLIAGVWFARKILKTIRASQEQLGALLKLSLTDELNGRPKPDAAAQRPTPYVMAEWPAATEAQALTLPQAEPHGNLLGRAWRGLIHWLQTPMQSGKATPWRRVLHWLQSPARS